MGAHIQCTEFSPGVFGVYKQVGQTPLQAIQEIKKQFTKLANTPLTYAGRLDPMAEGLLLLLDSSVVKNKEDFLKLDKVYEANILLGVETDSFDLLGIPTLSSLRADTLGASRSSQYYVTPAPESTFSTRLNPEMGNAVAVNPDLRQDDTGMHIASSLSLINTDAGLLTITDSLKFLVGKTTLPLPPYSSPPLHGKPLFIHAQEGTITPDNSPHRTTTIYSIELNNTSSITSNELLQYIQTYVPKVQGDFRIPKIIQAWEKLLNDDYQFPTITITANVSHGTYIRSLAHMLGKALGTGGCIYTLKRVSVGDYRL